MQCHRQGLAPLEQCLDVEDVDAALPIDVEQLGVVLNFRLVAVLEEGLDVEDVGFAVAVDVLVAPIVVEVVGSVPVVGQVRWENTTTAVGSNVGS